MKLSELHNDLHNALRLIYGHDNSMMRRSRLHQQKNHAVVDKASRTQGSRSYDGGTPWKKRHRRFFRMGNDGEAGTLRY